MKHFSVSILSKKGEILAILTPHQQRIPRKNKRNKKADSLMLRKEAIRDIVNPKNRSQEYNKIDKKGSQHKTSVPF